MVEDVVVVVNLWCVCGMSSSVGVLVVCVCGWGSSCGGVYVMW